MLLPRCRSCDTASAGSDIVIHAADIPAADRHGAWEPQADSTAADGTALGTVDSGWSSTSAPLAQPSDYFDVRFPAQAGRSYRVWLRLKAEADSKWNDSVWLQFSDARVNGEPAYGINSTEGLAINLENCADCGVAGWGWQDRAYWLARTAITFGTSGTQTMRVQTREDGVAIDQIVVSASAWVSASPGQVGGDSTIVARTPPSSPPGFSDTPGAPPVSTPFVGTGAALPGTVQVEDFDNGGEGVAYHDTDAANSGGGYRSTGVDIELSSSGTPNVGWVAPGEWLAYTVNLSAGGTYTAQFRVASYGPGGTFHLEAGGADVTGPITVPDTGWWQTWQTVSRTVTLPAGQQVLKLVMDSAGANAVGNFDWFAISGDTSGTTSGTALPGRIMAASFDDGGEGVAYHDDSAGNHGGTPRVTDVDLEPSSEGGEDIGWIGAGEWVRYTVSVAATGSYLLQIRVASPDGGGVLHVDAGRTDVTGSVAVPRTGGWQAWTTISVPVSLVAGQQALTLAFDAPGFNVRYVDVAAQ